MTISFRINVTYGIYLTLGLIGYTRVLSYMISKIFSMEATDMVSALGTVIMFQVLWCSFLLFMKNTGMVVTSRLLPNIGSFSFRALGSRLFNSLIMIFQ